MILPGMPTAFIGTSGPTVYSLTADTSRFDSFNVGYDSREPYGSLDPSTTPFNGGNILAIYRDNDTPDQSLLLFAGSPSPAPTNINIDGTDYALAGSGTTFTFASGVVTFVDGNTYEVTIT